jgi:hypothetical protein
MNISRRHLAGPLPVLGLVTIGMLGAKAVQALSADEETVAKRVEAFRSAQVAADAKAFDGLCAAELSYSHSDGRVNRKSCHWNTRIPRSAWLAMSRSCAFIGWVRAKPSLMARRAPPISIS